MGTTTLLRIEEVHKTFGGIVALDQFTATVNEDEITGLIGPNGAGKTTLFNVITGVLTPDSGSIRFEGKELTSLKSHQICHEGIGRTFQTPKPVRSLTVRENLQVARKYGVGDNEKRETIQSINEVIELFSLEEKQDTITKELQLVEQKFVDVARALVTGPKLILLDEIMAGLNPTEKQEMMSTIKTINTEFGSTFLIIEHDLGIIRSISDRIITIHEGSELTSGSPEKVMENDKVREAYIGK
ncbi:ABC transporter ATP-binding protein [Natrarchaeobius halalkaliphilus]|nr:ABC transporter ATP-binding protein [Natrarchaeobius halalkaliphilus]